jgi:hypothetical protein
MKYIILYFILNSEYYQLPLLPEMTQEDAIKIELVPREARLISEDEFKKNIDVKLDGKKKEKKSK